MHRWRISYEDHSRAKLPGLSPPLPPSPIHDGLYRRHFISGPSSPPLYQDPARLSIVPLTLSSACFLPSACASTSSCLFLLATQCRACMHTRVSRDGEDRVNGLTSVASVLEIEFNMVIKFVWS